MHYSVNVYETQNGEPIGNPILKAIEQERIGWFGRKRKTIEAIEGSPHAVTRLQPGTVYAVRLRFTNKNGKFMKLHWPKFNFHVVPQWEQGRMIGHTVVPCK